MRKDIYINNIKTNYVIQEDGTVLNILSDQKLQGNQKKMDIQNIAYI